MSAPFNLDDLEDLASSVVFQRGVDYYAAGSVGHLEVSAGTARALVSGSKLYQTRLWLNDGTLSWSCTCPHAGDGYFCKHAVAVGLAWIDASAGVEAEQQAFPVSDWLQQKDHAALIKLIIDLAQDIPELWQQLCLRAELADEKDRSPSRLRQTIIELTEAPAYLDWHAAARMARDFESVLDAMEPTLDSGNAEELRSLCVFASQRIDLLREELDDSNDEFAWSLTRLADLHLKACQQFPVDPLTLAEDLYPLLLDSDFLNLEDSVRRYGDLLGETGMAHLEGLASEEWQQVPALTERGTDPYPGNRWQITALMRALAERSGSLDALIAIEQKDLSSAYRYLRLAELCQAAGKLDMALEWAEKGLATFGRQTDSRLLDFIVERYLERNRGDKARELLWGQFEHRPELATYQKLHTAGQRLGAWQAMREKALAWLESPSSKRLYQAANDRSLQIQIALWERDPDAAWEAYQKGACNPSLELELAKAIEQSRPKDALLLYRKVIALTVEQTNNMAYERAIQLLRRLPPLMAPGEFPTLCQQLRQRFKAKRNFIKRLDELID